MSVLTVFATAVAAPGTRAQEDDKEAAPDPLGYVDGSFLRQYAGPGGLLREVSLRKPMLDILARTYAKHDKKDMAALVEGLVSMEAVDITPDRDDYIEYAQVQVELLERRLKAEGWERITAVRTYEVDVKAYVLTNGDEVRGVTILVHRQPDQFVFVNLAGQIELDLLSLVSDALDVAGLDAGTAAIERARADKKNKTDAATTTSTDGPSEDQDNQGKPDPNVDGK